jgi:hypothetical protein
MMRARPSPVNHGEMRCGRGPNAHADTTRSAPEGAPLGRAAGKSSGHIGKPWRHVMRFHLLARRMILAPVLALALAATIVACSSSSSSSVSHTASAAPSTVSASPASTASAAAQIKANWEAFFTCAQAQPMPES